MIMAQHIHQPDKLPSALQLNLQQRHQRWTALNELFRHGSMSGVLTGAYAGRFEAFSIAPGLTQLVELMARAWMPWQGKTFVGAQSSGYNILSNDSFPVVRLGAASYHTFLAHGRSAFGAFPFQTRFASSRRDPDQQVLVIDYDLPTNPRWSVRRLQDELVQIDEDVFLGKAYIKWWWGAWQLWAYFSLRSSQSQAATR